MSNWQSKSESNIKVSKLLTEDYANQSVHCSYYSCVQFSFHVLNSHFGMEPMEIQTQSVSSINGVGTHKWLRKLIFKSIRTKNKKIAQNFYDDMGEMFAARVSADYHHDSVEIVTADKVYAMANGTIEALKKFYEL